MQSVKTKSNKMNIAKILTIIAVVSIIIVRIISATYLSDVFCDEQDILNHLSSVLTNGRDANGNFLPLYSKVGGGLVTWTYLYPMALLLSIIGVGPIRARIVQQLLTILACFIIAIAIKKLTKNKTAFWISLFTCLILPWGFVQANRIWDPSFVPLYFSLHFLFFALLESNDNLSKTKTWFYYIGCSVFLVLLAVVYPPCRIPAVAMYVFCLVKFIKNKKINWPQIFVTAMICAVVSLPLVINLLNPEFNSRSADLLVFQGGNVFLELWQFIKNFISLINPWFLFVTGDANYRHSLPLFGMLGILSIVPIVFLIVRLIKQCKIHKNKSINKDGVQQNNESNSQESNLKSKRNYLYLIFIIIMTCISTALTNEGNPHSLRSCLCWLPYAILISFGYYDMFKTNKKLKILTIVLMVVTFLMTSITYFVVS